MGVTVITGRSGSGKSRFLMAHIKNIIKDPFAKIFVVVPGQLTFETEKKIMQSCGVAGILGLEVTSIQRLAFSVLSEAGSCSFISNAQKALIVGRALEQEGFGAIEGLEECTAELMTRLKSFCQTPKSLKDAAKNINDGELQRKLLKTARLYERYTELCAGRPDLSDIYGIAAAAAAKAEFLKGAHIVIDGLDSASPAVMKFLTEVIRLSSDAVAAFRGGGENYGDLFSSEEADMRRFIEAAKRGGKSVKQIKAQQPARYGCEELAYLEANLYRYPYKPYEGEAANIRLIEARSADEEVDMLALGILEELREGRRFRDIAVVGGGVDAYLPAIKQAFAQCGIAWFYDERRALSGNTLFEFLHDAISAAAGDAAAIEGYVYSAYSPLEAGERQRIRKYAKAYALRGWHFLNPFFRGDSEAAEAIRQKAMRPLGMLTRGIAAKTAYEQIEAVKSFFEACGANEALEAFCESINREDTRAEHEYFSQVWEKSAEALDGIAEVYGDRHIEPKTLCSAVKTAFSATKIALIPPSTDEVGIYDISVWRPSDTDVLFAIGVHDGVWPAKDDGAGIMSRAEREALFAAGLDIGVYDPSSEKLKVYTALSKPKQRLYISWNSKTGQPSIMVDRVKRLFPGLKRIDPQNAVKPDAQAGVLGQMAAALTGARVSENMLGVCSALMKRPGWSEKAERMLLRDNAAIPLDETEAAALYGGIRCSATRIEDYYRCPFKHFLDFGVKAQPERDYTNDKVDTGTYMHLALDIFTKKLLEDGADIKQLSEADTEYRMREAAAQAAARHDGGKLMLDERFALQYELLQNELVNTALRIRAHFAGSGAKIISSEQEFLGYSVDTESGEVMITGKIDRIDAAEGYFRVVDYKSSAADFSLKDFAGGVKIQLPVYIGAAKRLMESAGTGLEPAGGYYMRIGDAYRDSEEAVAKAARLSGISLSDAEALSSLSAVNEDGSFAAIDQALKASGGLRSKNRHFTAEEMARLLEYADGMIKSAAEAIYAGCNAINPAEGITGGDACAYCGYGSVCRMDAAYEGNAARTVSAGPLFGNEEDVDELE